MHYTRRDALKVGLFGSAALALPLQRAASARSALDDRMPSSNLPKPFSLPLRIPPIAVPFSQHEDEDCYRIAIKEAQAEILPGFQTTVWAYDGIVPGPTIVVQQGRKAKVRFLNQLPLQHPTLKYTPWTSVHLHGSASLPSDDGYASDITYPGEYKDYRYPNHQHARTLWYHDHGVHHTAENVNMGQAGAVPHVRPARALAAAAAGAVRRAADRSPTGCSRRPASSCSTTNDHSGMYGDVILVNGVPWPTMKVQAPQVPVPDPERLGVARLRVLAVDRRPVHGHRHRRRPDAVPADGHADAPHHGRALRGRDRLREVQAGHAHRAAEPRTRRTTSTTRTSTRSWRSTSPTSRSTREQHGPRRALPGQPGDEPAGQRSRSRRAGCTLERKHGLWTINGHTWDDVVASNFTLTEAKPVSDTVEIWELVNKSRRLAAPAAHPPDRLQDPRPQRQAAVRRTSRARRTSSTSARTRRCA